MTIACATSYQIIEARPGLERRQKPRAEQAKMGAEAYNEVVSVGWIGEKEIYLLFRLYTQDL